MRLMILRPFTSIISDNCAFVRLDVLRRRWLLPPLVRTTLPEPVRRKRLDVALWVLSFILPALALRGILRAPFRRFTQYFVYFRPRIVSNIDTIMEPANFILQTAN